VVDKINEFRAVLKDPSKSREDRRFALRFLVHCVEDMHMPMHVGDNHDRGGNDTQVRSFDRGMNMHSLCDSGMIERVSKNEDYSIKQLPVLPSLQSRDTTTEGTVEDWATESLLAARQAYLGARHRSADQVWSEAWRCLRRGQHAGGTPAALSGECPVGDGAQ
jgi:hypothetical protein